MCTPLYNETLRGCFTVGEKKKYQKIDDEWRACDRMQIPAHLTTHSAKSWSVFPDVTERVSASADQ